MPSRMKRSTTNEVACSYTEGKVLLKWKTCLIQYLHMLSIYLPKIV